jgi:hypothetical protein
MAAILLCDVLGVLCIFLNVFVIIALIRNRRKVLVNVFYVMVLHCAIVDLIRGGCLIAWGMPHLLVHNMRTIQDRLFALKVIFFYYFIIPSFWDEKVFGLGLRILSKLRFNPIQFFDSS